MARYYHQEIDPLDRPSRNGYDDDASDEEIETDVSQTVLQEGIAFGITGASTSAHTAPPAQQLVEDGHWIIAYAPAGALYADAMLTTDATSPTLDVPEDLATFWSIYAMTTKGDYLFVE